MSDEPESLREAFHQVAADPSGDLSPLEQALKAKSETKLEDRLEVWETLQNALEDWKNERQSELDAAIYVVGWLKNAGLVSWPRIEEIEARNKALAGALHTDRDTLIIALLEMEGPIEKTNLAIALLTGAELDSARLVAAALRAGAKTNMTGSRATKLAARNKSRRALRTLLDATPTEELKALSGSVSILRVREQELRRQG